jgi:hypothetical protein
MGPQVPPVVVTDARNTATSMPYPDTIRRARSGGDETAGRITFSTCSSDKGVAEALVFSSLVMLEILNVANQRFGLGLDGRLSEIVPRVQGMPSQLPKE